MSFTDRNDAGRRLGERLKTELQHERDVVVVGLPRGGVPVAYEVAEALRAPLDILLVHKLGVPFQPELAMGAIGDSGHVVLDEQTVRWAGVSREDLAELQQRELDGLRARGDALRQGRRRLDLHGKTVVIVDDGAATGLTALAACDLAKEAGARRVVVAVPVGSREAVEALEAAADVVVCLEIPRSFGAVGAWYRDFSQTSEREVVTLLDRAATHLAGDDLPERTPVEVRIPYEDLVLEGTLVPPIPGRGLVVFAHGSGSSRHSPRNRQVAQILDDAGLGTLLFDLLTHAEEGDRSLVFDIDMLAARLRAARAWVGTDAPGVRADTSVGYFGASTGAAAALVAAALTKDVDAVVSRGGRPDLAGDHLGEVQAPTLLIVGSRDTQVLALNREAQARLRCENRLDVVPGASHLFEERGTLDRAAELARGWFEEHLGGQAR